MNSNTNTTLPRKARWIALADAVPGQILAQSLSAVASSGRMSFKMGAGNPLTEDALEKLARHQIDCISIIDDADEKEMANRKGRYTLFALRLKDVFDRSIDNDEQCLKLYRALLSAGY